MAVGVSGLTAAGGATASVSGHGRDVVIGHAGRMEFLTLDEDDFEYGVAQTVAPSVRRVIAKNPSKFTYRGTGTYLIGEGDIAVVDPGPELESHQDALLDAIGEETVRAILITHCHADHSPLAAWLKETTGAPTFAFGPHAATTEAWDLGTLPEDFGRVPEGEVEDEYAAALDPDEVPKMEESIDADFAPDEAVVSGDEVYAFKKLSVRALHTPGHTSNHTCFTLTDGEVRTILTGDHVMGWSTTVVSPPDGDMAAYIESLRSVAGRNDHIAVPTHGPPIEHAGEYIQGLVDHRLGREAQVLDALSRGLGTIPEMVTEMYAAVHVRLHRPAAFSVLGHLVQLVDDGRVASSTGRATLDATYALN